MTTVVPFGSLPPCATACYKLYDANGACVPPVLPAFDQNCFCNFGPLQPWRTGAAGVCDGACTASSDLNSIVGWFDKFCSVTGNNQVTVTQTSTTPGSTSGASGGSSYGDADGGDW